MIRHDSSLVATMSDGCRLIADAWYPDDGAAHPVLLQRLPYGRLVASAPVLPSPVQLARRGYAVVVQDVRGRGDSEGEFVPFVNEARDSAETVEWAADLPFSDGNVVMYGFSYQGLMQIAAAALHPRGLRAIAPMMCALEPYEMLYEGGCLLWEASARWAAQLSTSMSADARTDVRLEVRPLTSALGPPAPEWYLDWVRHAERDHYWEAMAPDVSAIEVPVFSVLGYADTFASGTMRLIERLGAESVAGPWAHMPWGTDLGSVKCPDATPEVAHTAFFDFLKSALEAESAPSVSVSSYYVINEGWRSGGFPPRTRSARWHAASDFGANSRHGDGILVGSDVDLSLDDHVVSEPLVPVPGSLTPYPDVAAVEDRRDVLVYRLAPLTAPLTIVGITTVRATLHTEAPSVDLIASLVVEGDSGSIRIAFGACRVDVGSTDLVEVEVALSPIAWHLAVGSTLKLDLAATAYPLFVANPQAVRRDFATVRRGEHQVAVIELRQASIDLPVVDDAE